MIGPFQGVRQFIHNPLKNKWIFTARWLAWATPAVVWLACATPAVAQAPEQHPDFQFALLRYEGGNWNPRPRAFSRLAWEIRRRTSIAIDLAEAAVHPSQEMLFDYPLLVWLGDKAFPPLSTAAVTHLRQHLTMGGTLLVDLSDAMPGGPFDASVRRELRRILPDNPLARVPVQHVLYKSYYLLDRHGGRVQARSFLEGISVEDRLAVVISANDLAGAMARDEFGEWEYDVGPGGDASREVTFRLGINLVMYALCLDYKEDQVHIPFILRRRR